MRYRLGQTSKIVASILLTVIVQYNSPAYAADQKPSVKREGVTDHSSKPDKSQSAEHKAMPGSREGAREGQSSRETNETPSSETTSKTSPSVEKESLKETPKEEPKSPPRKPGKRVLLDRLEASVNSSMILTSDIKKFREVARLRAQLDPLFAGTPVANKGANASTADIVEFLINERLITQQYPKSDTEVEQEINSIQANNHLSRSALKEALSREGYKFTDYFELIRDSSSKRDLIDRDIRTKVTISDDDVKNYFYNNITRNVSAPRAYHIEMISISLASYKTSSAALKTAQDAIKSIQSGEPFEEVAKRVSDDPSASSGGDLGVLTEDQMSPTIRSQVKTLQIGKVSSILGGPTPSGKGASKAKGQGQGQGQGRYYILKLVDIKSSESDRFDKMKEEIRSQLAAGEYQHQISLWLERQRQSAFIHRTGAPSVNEIPLTR